MTNAGILIVEDEPISASVIQKKLKSLGYSITGVVSFGEEAIEKVAELHPDLVLMDIVLKGKMDGIEAAEKIRSGFDIPVIYLTACADENTLQRAKITEPYGYILKPCEERELHTSIEMALYRHQMERKLKEGKQWLTTILRGIGDAVIATDKNGQVSFMNPVAEELTGWKHNDALGRDLSNVFNVVKESATAETAGQAVKEGIKMPSNHILVTKDGTRRSIEHNASPLRDDNGEIWGSVLVFRDITERMRLEKEILDAKTEVELYLETGIMTVKTAFMGVKEL